MRSFYFGARVPAADLEVDLEGTQLSKSELLAALSEGLSFPTYFGHNWDALEDFLNDLSWLKERRIALRHTSLPTSMSDKDLATYLSILSSAVEAWQGRPTHELIVAFPLGARSRVQGIVGKSA